MSIAVSVNGVAIQYPQTGDSNWGDNATNFAIQTSAAFDELGLATGTTVDVQGTLDVTGNTTLDANLSVGGNASVTGNTTLTGNLTANGNVNLGNANTDTITVTGIVNVDSGVLYVDPATNRVGINKTNPVQDLDVTGNVAISGNETVGGTLGVTGNTTLSGTLGVTGNTTLTGQMLSSDGTASLPGISFSSDSNTGIFRSASDQLDIVTGGDSRFRIESTGQIKAVYESTTGTDYNTTLHNGYLCRAWVNFNGTGTVAIRASGNVSSITDNGTGQFTINYNVNLPDANYGFTSGGRAASIDGNEINISIDRDVAPTTSTTRIICRDLASNNRDPEVVSIGIFR